MRNLKFILTISLFTLFGLIIFPTQNIYVYAKDGDTQISMTADDTAIPVPDNKSNNGNAKNPSGTKSDSSTTSESTTTKTPVIINKDIYKDVVKNDSIRVEDIIKDRWTIQNGYTPEDNHAKKSYDMSGSAIYNPDYPSAKIEQVTNSWVDENTNKTYKEVYTYYVPRLYATLDSGSNISFNDNYKTLYFLWNLHGPIQLAHNADRTANFTDSSITWHGQQTEFVKIPVDKTAVGKYQSDSQPYKKWEIFTQDLYHYKYYEDW